MTKKTAQEEKPHFIDEWLHALRVMHGSKKFYVLLEYAERDKKHLVRLVTSSLGIPGASSEDVPEAEDDEFNEGYARMRGVADYVG